MVLKICKNVVRNFISFYSTSQREVINNKARVLLAAAYRGLDFYGLNEGICNHLSAIVPSVESNKNVMLIIPHGLHWSEVLPSSLIGVNENNEVVEGSGKPEITALCIHKGIYSEHEGIKCIMHTHMPYATALTCLEEPKLLMLHQNSARFYKKIAYDLSYGGLGDNIMEGKRLGKVLSDKSILFMGNHGVMTTASSIAVAFDNMYYLERAAMIQVLACSSNCAVREIKPEILELTTKQIWQDLDKYAESHLDTMIRRLVKDSSEFLLP